MELSSPYLQNKEEPGCGATWSSLLDVLAALGLEWSLSTLASLFLRWTASTSFTVLRFEDNRVGIDSDDTAISAAYTLDSNEVTYSWLSETSPVAAVNPRYGLSGSVTVVSKHFFQSSVFFVWTSSSSLDLDLTYVNRPFVGASLRRNESSLSVSHRVRSEESSQSRQPARDHHYRDRGRISSGRHRSLR
jgi:hypothetical protein